MERATMLMQVARVAHPSRTPERENRGRGGKEEAGEVEAGRWGGFCNPQQYNPGKTRDRPCSEPGL